MSFLQLVLSLDKTIKEIILLWRICQFDRYHNTDNTWDAGNRGVLGAGLRGSRIPETAGVHRAQGTGNAELRGAGLISAGRSESAGFRGVESAGVQRAQGCRA